MEDPRRSSSACRPERKCACDARTSSAARCHQERRRRHRRAALQLRSGNPRRRRAGWPQGEGDAALGVGGACSARGSAAVRPSVLRRRSGERPRRTHLHRPPEPAFARRAARRAGRAVGGRPWASALASSSSGWATSVWTRIPEKGHWCSTARSRFATRGRRSRSAMSNRQKHLWRGSAAAMAN